jgi:DoxX-like family
MRLAPARRAKASSGGVNPSWWHLITGGLEILSAILIALPLGRDAGLVLGTIIIAAALLTVLRHREYSDLAPPSVFLALIALAAFSS